MNALLSCLNAILMDDYHILLAIYLMHAQACQLDDYHLSSYVNNSTSRVIPLYALVENAICIL